MRFTVSAEKRQADGYLKWTAKIESYRGTSYLPFLGFMVFFAGMMIAFIGIVKISNSRHQWNIFYDERDRKDLKSPAVNKDRKTGIIMLVVGIVMMIVSFLIR